MAPRETENNAQANFWGDQQRALWYVMVFSGVVNSDNKTDPNTVQKEVLLILPYFGLQSRILTKQLSAWINKFYGWFDLQIFVQSTRRITALSPQKDRFSRTQMLIVYKTSCWDCQDFYVPVGRN